MFTDILRRRSANGGMIRNGVSSDLMRETQRYLPSHPNSEWIILENLFNDSPKTRPILRSIRENIGNSPLGSPQDLEIIQLSGVEVRVDELGNIVFLDLMNRLTDGDINDLSKLEGLKKLQTLSIRSCLITQLDLTGLSSRIKELNLMYNDHLQQIDFYPLRPMGNMIVTLQGNDQNQNLAYSVHPDDNRPVSAQKQIKNDWWEFTIGGPEYGGTIIVRTRPEITVWYDCL